MAKEIISPITNEEIQAIRQKTPTYLSNRPNQEGFSPQYLKDIMAHALLDNKNSIVALMQRIINSMNNSDVLIRILPVLPTGLELKPYAGTIIYVKDTKSFYEVVGGGNDYFANKITIDCDKLNYETNTDRKITLQSSQRVKIGSSEKAKFGYSSTGNVDHYNGDSNGNTDISRMVWDFEKGKTTLRNSKNSVIIQYTEKDNTFKILDNDGRRILSLDINGNFNFGPIDNSIKIDPENEEFAFNLAGKEIINAGSESVNINNLEGDTVFHATTDGNGNSGINVGDSVSVVANGEVNLIPNFNNANVKNVFPIDYNRIKIGGAEIVRNDNNNDAESVILSYKPKDSLNKIVPFAITEEGKVYYQGSEIAKNDYLQKQIDNLKASAEGKTFNYETDSSVSYQKSVPSNASPYAVLSKVGGMSYKSKNIFDFSKITHISFGSFDSTNKTITVNAKWTSGITKDTLKELCPSLNVGDTIYCYAKNSNEEAHKSLILSVNGNTGTAMDYGSSQGTVLTEYMLSHGVGFSNNVTSENTNTISDIVISKEPITEYEEYYEGIRGTLVTNVKSVGENLFNVANQTLRQSGVQIDIQNGNFTFTGTATDDVEFNFYFDNPLPPYNYGLSLFNNSSVADGGFEYGFITENGKFGIEYNKTSNVDFSYDNYSQNSKILGIYIFVNIGANMTNCTMSPMVTSGRITQPITEFKNYFEENKEIPLINRLIQSRGVNENNYNYIDLVNGKLIEKCNKAYIDENVGTIVLSQTTNSSGEETGFYKFAINNFVITNLKSRNSVNAEVIQTSSIPNYTNWNNYSNLKYEQLAIQNNNLFIIISKEKASTVEEFKDWLSQNPFEIEYVLNTPIETDISDQLIGINEFIKVQSKGSLTFENEYNQASGSEVLYEVKIV